MRQNISIWLYHAAPEVTSGNIGEGDRRGGRQLFPCQVLLPAYLPSLDVANPTTNVLLQPSRSDGT